MTIKVIIADYHFGFRKLITSLLQYEEDIEVIAEAGDSQTTQWLLERMTPNIVIVDPNMPNMTGSEMIKLIQNTNPESEILVISLYSDMYMSQEMIDSGAAGYILKDYMASELAGAIRSVVAGETVISQQMSI